MIVQKVLFKKNALKQIGISPKDIHVWSIDLISCSDNSNSLYNLLSFDERKRANAYRFEKDRINFITVRGILRKIISSYLFVEPNEINFLYTQYGKPYLENQDKLNALFFNMSHSGDFALCIFAINREVGIDIEKVHPLDNYEDIAQQFFSVNEYLQLKSIPQDLRLNFFFRYWTLKEAFIKAIGKGLSYPLNDFEVQLKPNEPPRLINIKNNTQLALRWFLNAINPSVGYEAAFAFEGPFDNIEYWQYLP
jgi:4'-phosphopantetheinyl transferase